MRKSIKEALKRIEQEEMKIAIDKAEIETIDNDELRIYSQQLHKLKVDELEMLKVYAELGAGQRLKALRLVEKLHRENGEFREQADSHYRIINE